MCWTWQALTLLSNSLVNSVSTRQGPHPAPSCLPWDQRVTASVRHAVRRGGNPLLEESTVFWERPSPRETGGPLLRSHKRARTGPSAPGPPGVHIHTALTTGSHSVRGCRQATEAAAQGNVDTTLFCVAFGLWVSKRQERWGCNSAD